MINYHEKIFLTLQLSVLTNASLLFCSSLYSESISYEFGNNKGIIQYTFPANLQADTEEDNMALGFITTKSDAVLLRIESSTTQDYMELEIVEGNIFMCYNIGTRDLPLGEIGTKVNDNTYHVVRFSRIGGNASLQLDDYNVQALNPQGIQKEDRIVFSHFVYLLFFLQVINLPFLTQWPIYKWAVNTVDPDVFASNDHLLAS